MKCRSALLLAALSIASASAAPPAITVNAPAANATGIGTTTTLDLTVTDPEGQATTVAFFGRKTAPSNPGPDFVVGTLPDTQFYSQNTGGIIAHFNAQTDWYAANRARRNIVFVSHMGDMVNTSTTTAEWQRASDAMARIENRITTGLGFGLPWGGAPGNHDLTAGAPSAGFNTFFGESRFAGRSYYRGHLGSTNDNNCEFFTASGLDFMVLHLTYQPTDAQIAWATGLIAAHPNRRTIITSHEIIDTGNPAPFRPRGQALYDAVKAYPNVILLLCGHVHGEGLRTDTHLIDGTPHTIATVLQDYQSAAAGGSGFFRLYTFSPANNTITVSSYSPSLGRAATTADVPTFLGQFVLPCDLQGPITAWVPLGTATLAAGETHAALPWTGLEPDSHYEWYATATDGTETASSPARRFATTVSQAPSVALATGGTTFTAPATIALTATASDADGTIVRVEFYHDGTKLGEATTPPYAYTWSAVPAGTYPVAAVAIDDLGLASVSPVATLTVAGSGATFTYSQNFDSMGTAGTVAPTGWSVFGAFGGSNTTWTNSAPITGASLLGGSSTTTLTATTTFTAMSDTNGFNYALSAAPSNRCLGTSPTTGRGVALQLSLTNSTAGPITELTLGYDIRRLTAPASANELPGYRLFYSLDAGSSWTPVAALDPTLTNVPNTVGVTTIPPTVIPLASSWAAGSTLRLRWVDDNAAQSSPDQVLGLDNVALTANAQVPNTPPAVAIASPIPGAVYTAPATIPLAATASDSDGTVAQVEYLQDSTSLGAASNPPYGVSWTGVPAGNYTLTALATDDDGASTTSAAVNLTVLPAGTGGYFAYNQNFNAMGTGSTLPAGWSVFNGAATSSRDSWTTSIAAAGPNSVADMVAAAGPPVVADNPTANQNNGYNAATPGQPTDRLLATAPTVNAGSALQLALVNTSGAAIPRFTLSFDLRRFTAATAPEVLPGFQLFTSLDGGATWANFAPLNPALTGTPPTVVVPNAAGVTTVPPTVVVLPSPWAANATLLLRWVDDNATAPSPDQIIGLDNVSISAMPAPVIVSAPSATGRVGSAFAYTVAATHSPTAFAAAGLPTGLSINPATGEISGTPAAAGTFAVTLSATNAGGTGQAPLALTIQPEFANPFEAWISPLAPAGLRGPADAPAGDGVPNLFKFVAKLDPLTPSTEYLPKATVHPVDPDRFFGLLFRSLDPATIGVVVELECAASLDGTWAAVPAVLETLGAAAPDGTRPVRLRETTPLGAADRRFGRLRIAIIAGP